MLDPYLVKIDTCHADTGIGLGIGVLRNAPQSAHLAPYLGLHHIVTAELSPGQILVAQPAEKGELLQEAPHLLILDHGILCSQRSAEILLDQQELIDDRLQLLTHLLAGIFSFDGIKYHTLFLTL